MTMLDMTPLLHRVPPTPEDQLVFQRGLHRILRGCHATGRDARETMAVVHRWTWDYLGVTPVRPMQICRGCGCDDDHACPGGCWWSKPGLCSTCARAGIK
jgi:hypothetical protein